VFVDKLDRWAREKGYFLEKAMLLGKPCYRIRRMNWYSDWFINLEALEFYVRNKVIDWGRGYIP
jgi:hypothetical protein